VWTQAEIWEIDPNIDVGSCPPLEKRNGEEVGYNIVKKNERAKSNNYNHHTAHVGGGTMQPI